jgi:sulfite reductase (NADPH) flavoprotein alpha-component
MTAPARLPTNAPFPPDAIATLNRVIEHTSPTQRSWLAGFLAGYEAAGAPAAAAATAPVAKPAVTILFATESGNSEALARKAGKDAARLGFAPRVLDAAEATPADLARTERLLVIASTWGEGEAPARATGFLAAMLADDAPRMEKVNFAVLALGDRAYAQFCATGRILDERLAALGGRRAAPLLECDLDYDAPAAAWLATTLPELRGAAAEPSPSVIHVDFGAADAREYSKSNPFQAEITDLVNLNSSRSLKQTFHVELSLAGSGLTYQPGDAIGIAPENDPAVVEAVLDAAGQAGNTELHAALLTRHDVNTLSAYLVRSLAELTKDPAIEALAADKERLDAFLPGRQVVDLLSAFPNRLTPAQLTGLLRPLPPRLYSVASSQAMVGEEAHLLVGAVRYQAHGRDRAGVASTHIADRRRAGDHLGIHVKANPHFRLPADPATPVIMIGPGTGVAPFRAFMQERDAAGLSGKSWLFFGDQRYTHDFLYQLEWQDMLERGVLGRLDVAFSRDQDAKSYVQHRMWDNRRDLHAWLEDGAQIYVCGDQVRMARDVHTTLRDIIAGGAAISPEAAEERLAGLKQQGRYLLDVY